MSHNCSLLAWDSDYWGFPVARLHADKLTAPEAGETIRWCDEQGVRCLFFAADGNCRETLRCAWAQGFKFVDQRVEMAMTASETTPLELGRSSCRVASADDLPSLAEMARVSHRDTRFFKDAAFDSLKAENLYATWIAKDVRENKVLVAESSVEKGRIIGYISTSLDDNKDGRISLLAVDQKERGRGVGRLLVHDAIDSLFSRGSTAVRVATQGANVSALRLYQNCGFRVTDVKVWFHRWFDPKEWI